MAYFIIGAFGAYPSLTVLLIGRCQPFPDAILYHTTVRAICDTRAKGAGGV